MKTRKLKPTKVKNYFFIIVLILTSGVLTTSCADNFDEEELLLRQQERSDRIAADEAAAEAADEAAEEALSAANAAALAAAANLTYTITLHSDDVPVADADVILTNQNGGSTAAVTTDANGNAIFTDIDLGGYNVAISSDNHLNASYLVDFGSPQDGVHYEWVNGSIVALEQSEASKIELLELNGTQTATIKGNVEIETDLTNNTPEIPLDVTIRANLDSFNGMFEHTNNSFNGSNNPDSFYIPGSFSLTEGDIGSADVNPNTGDYAMMVPTQEEGTTIELLFPLVEAEQTLAFSNINGQDLGAQVGTQAAVFGPDIVTTTTPSIKGVVAEFTASPEPGRGFNVTTFTAQERGLGGSAVSIDNFPVESDLSEIRFRGSQGSGYQLTPRVTVSNPDLSGPSSRVATVEAWMSWALESVAYTGQPAFTYNNNEEITIGLEISDENGPRDIYDLAKINAGVIGQLVAGSVDVDSALLMAPDGDNVITTDYVVTSFAITFTGNGTPTGTLTRSGSVDVFRIPQGGAGQGYTDIPTIDVEAAPQGGINATLEITDMAFLYYFDLDNTGVIQPYAVLPDVFFEYTTTPSGSTEVFTSVNLALLDDHNFLLATFGFPFPDLKTTLTVSGNQLLFDEDYFGSFEVSAGVLTIFSYTIPRAIVVEPTHSQTTADVDVNADGEITGLSNITHGRGYNTTYDVQLTTLDGLAGSGAEVELVGFSTTNERTGELTWSENFIIKDGGSGYTLDVNIPEEPFTPETASQSLTVKNGQTKIINVNYGTGKPVADLE
ncbi:carboxypeptidase-like regulatory domain-containing protein [Flagellimonas sp. W118]|uniref:carboxypeptidase-like regulatory domain-containing protein n=1 Tax=Flagellimonas sp. W118 TaxID=3410791 RepID=UPI003BF5E8D8